MQFNNRFIYKQLHCLPKNCLKQNICVYYSAYCIFYFYFGKQNVFDLSKLYIIACSSFNSREKIIYALSQGYDSMVNDAYNNVVFKISKFTIRYKTIINIKLKIFTIII